MKANRGAPGPDGITITEFPTWFRPRWNAVRQQLLDGTYQPQPVRRVTIDKPDGGKRLLGIRNLIDRLIQQAIVSQKSIHRFKYRIREITGRSRGISMDHRLRELARYVRDWMGYFAPASQLKLFASLEQWIRRRIRCCYWKR